MSWGHLPHLEMGSTVAAACLELLEGRASAADVFDGDRCVGIVTTADLARVADRQRSAVTLGEVLAARRAVALGPFSGSPCDHRPYGLRPREQEGWCMTIDPRTWLEILGTEECWELLDAAPVGRLAVVTDHHPEIFPVNYATDARTIVFRTEAGSKLAAVDGNPSVCFEIDHVDLESRSGWSVVVQGRAATVRTPEGLRALQALPLDYWSIGDKPNFVRITPTSVTGRRIHPHDAAA